MRRLLQLIPVLFIVAGAALVFERPAYAYADPGTGLLAIQAAGSALIATGWFLRRKFQALLHWRHKTTHEAAERDAQKEDEGSSLR